MIFGSYPKVLTTLSLKGKAKTLRSLINSYLLKDILALEDVKGSKILLDLLRLLAFQMGNEVSFSKLAQNLPIEPIIIKHLRLAQCKLLTELWVPEGEDD